MLIVLEYLKDRASDIRTVYVNSLDPNGIVWRLGKPQFRKVYFETFVRPGNFLISPLSSLFEATFSQDVAKEGSYLLGIFCVPLRGSRFIFKCLFLYIY